MIFGVIAFIWALVWSSSAFRDIPSDKNNMGTYVTFDIVFGSLYAAIAVVEAYGFFAVLRAKITLVRIYAYLSLAVALMVIGIEILDLVLHFTFKQQLLDNCFKYNQGITVIDGGSVFSGDRPTRILTDQDVRDACDSDWNKGIFQDVAWLLVAGILGFLFAAMNFAYLRQLLDPNMNRSQAPSAAYQMNPTRNPFGYQSNNIPGYNPYQTQSYGDYAPPYDNNNKPPGYMPNPGYINMDEDEKLGYSAPAAGTSKDIEAGATPPNPFVDPQQQQGYHPPPGTPPPGLEPYEQNFNHDRSKDEGFDTATLEAAIKKSEVETKGPGRTDDSGAGPSSQ